MVRFDEYGKDKEKIKKEEIYSYSVTAIDRKFSFLCDK